MSGGTFQAAELSSRSAGLAFPTAIGPLSWAGDGVSIVCLGLYLLCGLLGQALARGTPPLPPWNPAIALVIVLVLLRGARTLPLLVAAACVCVLVTADRGASLFFPLAWRVGEVLIYGTAALLWRHRLRIDPQLPGFEDAFRFLAVASLAALAMALLYGATLWPDDHGIANLWVACQRYWLADMIGLTVIAPLLLVHRHLLRDRPSLRALLRWEVLAQYCAIACVLYLIFPRAVGSRYYPMFIPLVWIAARQGLAGVTVALLFIQASFIAAIGWFDLMASQVVKLQILTLVLSSTGLLLGAVISERERARASVIEGEARLKAIIDMAPDGMLIVDDAGCIERINHQFATISAMPPEDSVGRAIDQVLVAIGPAGTGPMAVLRPDGSQVPVETTSASLTISGRDSRVVVVRDITARKQAEAQLGRRRSEIELASRSSLTGELAAALAHELNQPLTAVMNYTAASRRLLDGAGDRARALEQMTKASLQAERAGEVIRRLRAFFCNAPLITEAVPLEAMITEILLLCADEIERVGSEIDVMVDPALLVQVDKGQIQQVLINLLRNSLDAMAGMEPESRLVRITAEVQRDRRVRVSLADSGPGIAQEISDRLFTPFTTTRTFGMGLGLSISRSIVEAHGGQLWLASAPEQGGAILNFTVRAAAEAA